LRGRRRKVLRDGTDYETGLYPVGVRVLGEGTAQKSTLLVSMGKKGGKRGVFMEGG